MVLIECEDEWFKIGRWHIDGQPIFSRQRGPIWPCTSARSASHKRTWDDSFLCHADPWDSSCIVALFAHSSVPGLSSRQTIASSRLCGTRIRNYWQCSSRTSDAWCLFVLVVKSWEKDKWTRLKLAPLIKQHGKHQSTQMAFRALNLYEIIITKRICSVNIAWYHTASRMCECLKSMQPQVPNALSFGFGKRDHILFWAWNLLELWSFSKS